MVVGTNLDLLSQATAITTYNELATDLERFAYASCAAETLDRLTLEGEADRYLFDTFDTIDGEVTPGMSNQYIDFLQENMNPINYTPRGSKKSKK